MAVPRLAHAPHRLHHRHHSRAARLAPQCAGVAARRYHHRFGKPEPDAGDPGRRATGADAGFSCRSGAVSAHHSRVAPGAARLFAAERAHRRRHPQRLVSTRNRMTRMCRPTLSAHRICRCWSACAPFPACRWPRLVLCFRCAAR